MDKLQPKAILFDLGSTLIEYESVPWDVLGRECVATAYQYLVSAGHVLTEPDKFAEAYDKIRDRYRQTAKTNLIEWSVPDVARELLTSFDLNPDEELIDAFFDAYYGPVAEKLYVFEEVADTLALLRGNFPVIGLISNTIFPARAHIGELQRFGIESFFDFKIFSSDFGLRKPHQDIFVKAANLAGFAPSECVYVGDRYYEDITGPEAIGMPAILRVKPGREYPEDMPQSVRKIDTLNQLVDHIQIGLD